MPNYDGDDNNKGYGNTSRWQLAKKKSLSITRVRQKDDEKDKVRQPSDKIKNSQH